ncbi:Gx transporter family protein [Thermosipho ferrireducens]|uniref:Gx transporter family protein n=1 Tax=Thermosipho ferrireducens TaxID=2571116 RepID=A0ABX7S8B6_9BACT|nr:Gx transporter family protein [Thermosipho ferrireducens]QTA38839.1 Gx transporter family protein [Thermosipho ferrireducens]
MVIYSFLISISSVMYVVETIIPYPVPGGKWGFSNFVVLFSAVNLGVIPAIVVATLKSLLGSLFTGTLFSPAFMMGFTGVLFAAILQGILARLFIFGYVGLSIGGMIVNNLVQLLIGSFLIKSSAIYAFLPVMMFLGTISAIANAYLAKKMEDVMNENSVSFWIPKKEKTNKTSWSSVSNRNTKNR